MPFFILVLSLLQELINVLGLGRVFEVSQGGMFGGLGNRLFYGLAGGVSVGLVGGLAIGLQNGGSACLKHYVLRALLWGNDYAPRNYIRFLDYAAERVFLHKAGGGYIFTHRLLMEYFATLEPTEQAEQGK